LKQKQIKFDKKVNKIKKAIISTKSAIASVKANPIIANRKSLPSKEGLRDKAISKAPKTEPIPTPIPAKPTVATPAPISFAAVTSITKKKKTKFTSKEKGINRCLNNKSILTKGCRI
jgi:hypothetical protein